MVRLIGQDVTKGLFCKSCAPTLEQAGCPQPVHVRRARALDPEWDGRTQHPAGAIQPSAGMVPALQMRPPPAALKRSQPPRLQRVPGRTAVCLSAVLCTNSLFCKYISHEQLAPTMQRSQLCPVVWGSCPSAGTEESLNSSALPAAFPGGPQPWVCTASPPVCSSPLSWDSVPWHDTYSPKSPRMTTED